MRIVGEHHATNPRTVGSTAHGDHEPGSDLDLLPAFNGEATLLDEVGFPLDLTDLLGIPWTSLRWTHRGENCADGSSPTMNSDTQKAVSSA